MAKEHLASVCGEADDPAGSITCYSWNGVWIPWPVYTKSFTICSV
jgi:hypothetical protein